jgi:hypothetical protein
MGHGPNEPMSQLQLDIKLRAEQANIQGRNPELYKMLVENVGNKYQCSPKNSANVGNNPIGNQNFMRKQYQQQEIIFKVVSDLEFHVNCLHRRHKEDIDRMNKEIINSEQIEFQPDFLQLPEANNEGSGHPGLIRDAGSLHFGSKIHSVQSGHES